MPKNKTTFEARGILIEIHPESTGEGHKARISTIVVNENATITDLFKAASAAQKALMLKASKAKQKAAKKEKAKARKGGKSKVIAEARAPRKRKLRQGDMFKDAPEENITPENLDERFPPENTEQVPAPSTANSCVMG